MRFDKGWLPVNTLKIINENPKCNHPIMYIVIFCFVLFAFRACIIWKKKGTTLAFSLYALYALSFLSTILMGMVFPFYCDNIRLLPAIYLLFVFCIWFEVFDYNYDVYVHDPRNKLLANIMLVLMIPTLLYYLYYLRIVISSGLFALDENIRVLLMNEQILPSNTLSSITGFIASLYFVNIFLFYIGIIEKWGWKYYTALFVSSLAFPAYCLCYFGRDGVVLWILNFLIIYLLFRKFFTSKTKKIVLRIIIVFVALSLSLITFISVNRFFNDSAGFERNMRGTLGYMGQQLGNFCDLFGVDFQYRGTIFPGFRTAINGFLGIKTQGVGDLLDSIGLSEERNVFRFYVYAFITSYGYLGAIVVSLVFSAIIGLFSKKSFCTDSNLYLLLILILYQVPMNGVFYYRQSVGRGDIAYAIGIVIILFVYRFNEFSQSNIIRASE